MRFRPEQHLRRPAEIRAVRELGRRVDARAFTLWWRERELAEAGAAVGPTGSRVCVIASGKAVGRAVRRNRAKRRLRELFRCQQQGVPPRCDVVLVARAGAADWPMAELQARFTDACARIAPPVE
ncbi:MAG: ribonuclease P protein component [Opitutaceae bacterium]|nr:ribonuclease P protein component [Opitutaceae bacterium]